MLDFHSSAQRSMPMLDRLVPRTAITRLLAAVGAVAIAIPAIIVASAGPVAPQGLPPRIQRVVSRAELPPVEPTRFIALAPQDARAVNASIPFSTARNPAARPFRLSGNADDRARAIDCMAAAVLFEAGDDTLGQRAVAQVVINRVRHPAFPKTICGVVFQGSERRTGCQFTFTCDGALASRRWSQAARRRAVATAAAALGGEVFRPVGYATHYHTDWVVPYWSASLDKVAAVNTHLFFRWTGWWGTPAAFTRHVAGAEPAIASLAWWSDAHRAGAALDPAGVAQLQGSALPGRMPQAIAGDANSFLVTLTPGLAPQDLVALAAATCGDRAYCKFMGWKNKALTPTALPLEPSQVAALSFSYLRDRARGYDKPLWNCAEFKRPPGQCMKLQTALPADTTPLAERRPLAVALGAVLARPAEATPDGLAGVRRRVTLRAVPSGATAPSADAR